MSAAKEVIAQLLKAKGQLETTRTKAFAVLTRFDKIEDAVQSVIGGTGHAQRPVAALRAKQTAIKNAILGINTLIAQVDAAVAALQKGGGPNAGGGAGAPAAGPA